MTICIPKSFSSWGNPQWWSSTAANYDGHIDDLRWESSYSYGYGDGVGPVATLRVEWTDQAILPPSATPTRALLISWHVASDPTSTVNDECWIGIQTKNGELFLQLKFSSTGALGDASPSGWVSGAFKRDVDGTVTDLASPLSWLASYARAWRKDPSGSNAWAFQICIPLLSADITDSPAANDSGVRIEETGFKMWVYGAHRLGDIGATFPFVGFTWPLVLQGGSPRVPDYDAYDRPIPPALSDVGRWNDCQIGTTCAGARGVSLVAHEDIGTTNTPSTAIDLAATNTFYAKPTNGSGSAIASGQIQGEFRLTNWGSAIGDATQWFKIPLTAVPPSTSVTNHGIIADGAQADATNDILGNWLPDAAFAAEVHSGARSHYQCMLCLLSAAFGAVEFSKAYGWQNMHYVDNSVQRRNAEINVRGLKERPGAVLLSVEERGLTAEKYDWREVAERAVKARPQDAALKKAVAKLTPILTQSAGEPRPMAAAVADALRGVSLSVVQNLLPSVRFHVYYPTGQIVKRQGQAWHVYALGPSFGYVGVTVAADGWRSLLDRAFRVEENLYALPIPLFGRARVPVAIQARHGAEQALPRPPIRPIKLPGAPTRNPLDPIIDQIGLVDRVARRVERDLVVLSDISRYAKRAGDRFSKLPVGRGALVVQGVERQATALMRRLQALNLRGGADTLSQDLAALDRFLTALYAHTEESVDEVVMKASPRQEGIVAKLIDLEQRAHEVAAALSPLLSRKEASMRKIHELLGAIDEVATSFQGLQRELDRGHHFRLTGPVDADRLQPKVDLHIDSLAKVASLFEQAAQQIQRLHDVECDLAALRAEHPGADDKDLGAITRLL